MLYYLHIPKTGGVSVTSLFRRAAEEHNKRLLAHVILDDLTPATLSGVGDYDYVCGHLGTLPLAATKCSYVVTIRDPVRHLLSWYAHILRAPDHYLHAPVVNHKVSFEEWITHDEFKGLVRNPQAKYLAVRPALQLSHDHIPRRPEQQIAYELKNWDGSEEALYQLASETLRGSTLTGTTENLSDFQQKLCSILAIEYIESVKLNCRTDPDYAVPNAVKDYIRYTLCSVDQRLYDACR